MARRVVAVGEREGAEEPVACIRLDSVDDSRLKLMVRDYMLETPVTVAHLQKLADLEEDFVVPVASDVLLEALSAHIEADYRRSLLFAAIAVETLATNTLTAAYRKAVGSHPPEPSLRVITLRTSSGATVKDPVYDALISGKPDFRRLLHECPLYLLGKSLLCDDDALFRRAQRLYKTRNAIAHGGGSTSEEDTTYSSDFQGSVGGLETAIGIFRWFGDQSPYTPWTHFVSPSDPPQVPGHRRGQVGVGVAAPEHGVGFCTAGTAVRRTASLGGDLAQRSSTSSSCGPQVFSMKNRRPGDVLYAVAVRDGGDLLLYCTIRRVVAGDIYVNLHGGKDRTWEPHVSHHVSGQRHHKAFGKKMHVANAQRPDESFLGEENIVTISISASEPRAINDACSAANFTDVFEIPQAEIRPEKYRTYLSVDVVEPGKGPIVTPGAKVLRKKAYTDSLPWILVTLFDTGQIT